MSRELQQADQMGLDAWLAALESRHLRDLEFSEASRALRALSSTYVERRTRLATAGALDTRGKRAAYALYYGPLHWLATQRIVQALGLAPPMDGVLVDLGCGTGAAGAAWASALTPPPEVVAIDHHPWAVAEAALTYRAFGLEAQVRRGHVARVALPRRTTAIVCGWLINELDDATRAAMATRLQRAMHEGIQVLIVEPIATRVSPWWRDWVGAFATAGARADEWRFPVTLPDLVRRLDRAAGMRHDVLTARSLFGPSRPSPPSRPSSLE